MRKTLNKMLAILLIAVMVMTLAPIIESKAASRIYLEASVNNGATSLTINEEETYQMTETGVTKEIGFSEDLTFWLLTEDKMLYWYNYKYQGSDTIQFHLMDTNVTSLVRNSDNRVIGYVASDEEKAIFTEEQVKLIVENNTSQGINIPIKSTITPTPVPTSYKVSMRVNNGKMVLTINETESYEITGTGVTKDGGFSEDCTLWLLTKDQKLFWYSYEYQGSDSIKLHLLDTNVESLIRNSDDRIIGYVSNSVNKSVLSEEQIKLIIDNNISAEIDIPITVATVTPEPTETSTPKPTATATPKPTATVTPGPTATATPKPTVTSTPIPTATAKPEPTVTSTPRPTATVTPEPTATSTPRPTATVTPEPTATSTPRPTATVTARPTVTATPTPTPKVTYAARVNTRGTRKELYNSKEKRVDSFKLKKGTLTYHGWCVKNVKFAEFNIKGNVIVITKKGKLISINYKTMRKKTIKKNGIKTFKYNSKGMVTYAIDKNNKKIKLSKY